MKRIFAAAAAICFILLLAGCKGVLNEPTTGAKEPSEGASARDVTETTAPEEITDAVPETSETQTGSDDGDSTENYYKPTELVTYSEKGIPITNAYFSLRLPAEWDGDYYCATGYNGNVMTVTFKERESAEAGAGGTLFMLSLVPEGTEYDLPSVKELSTLTDGSNAYTLYAVYPTDVQFSQEAEERYAAMSGQIDDILGTLEPGAGFLFTDRPAG